ncbi:MAG: inner-membrane translocator [Pseudomonadota bacterium]
MSTKEKISLILLMAVYLLVTVRYFPGRPLETLTATLRHWLESVPFIIGLTILSVSILKKMAGAKLPLNRIIRIYLTFGLIGEVFYGIYNYVNQGNI